MRYCAARRSTCAFPSPSTTLPGRTRAQLRDSPQRIASARAHLARLRMPNSYDPMRTRLDEGLRLIAEANKRARLV